eukprot:scaffold31948_cov69-Cyclotella_meneghiniana.AAC.13
MKLETGKQKNLRGSQEHMEIVEDRCRVAPLGTTEANGISAVRYGRHGNENDYFTEESMHGTAVVLPIQPGETLHRNVLEYINIKTLIS